MINDRNFGFRYNFIEDLRLFYPPLYYLIEFMITYKNNIFADNYRIIENISHRELSLYIRAYNPGYTRTIILDADEYNYITEYYSELLDDINSVDMDLYGNIAYLKLVITRRISNIVVNISPTRDNIDDYSNDIEHPLLYRLNQCINRPADKPHIANYMIYLDNIYTIMDLIKRDDKSEYYKYINAIIYGSDHRLKLESILSDYLAYLMKIERMDEIVYLYYRYNLSRIFYDRSINNRVKSRYLYILYGAFNNLGYFIDIIDVFFPAIEYYKRENILVPELVDKGVNLTKSQLKFLSDNNYSILQSSDYCIICLSNTGESTAIRCNNCNKIIGHYICLFEWFATSNNSLCPICRGG